MPSPVNTEVAICKPCVLFEDGKYKMWYCYRGDAYRIGYAESDDGIKFERQDEKMKTFDVGKTGSFDSYMLEYPFVFREGANHIMLYNGDGFGKTGIGIAVSEE